MQPAASAGATLRVIIEAGKFHGVIAAHTPTGSFSATHPRRTCQTYCIFTDVNASKYFESVFCSTYSFSEGFNFIPSITEESDDFALMALYPLTEGFKCIYHCWGEGHRNTLRHAINLRTKFTHFNYKSLLLFYLLGSDV